MYGKIFESMYDGTLVEDWQGLVTFQQLIVLADETGIVDMTPRAISNRTGIPLELIEKGIQFLEEPDPYSRTEGEEGRRLERLDAHRPWGWQIVNYDKYRKMASREEKKEADRERIRIKREANGNASVASCREVSQVVAECSEVSQVLADVAHTDTDTNTHTKKNKDLVISNDLKLDFNLFWVLWPKKLQKELAIKSWVKLTPDEQNLAIEDIRTRPAKDQQWADQQFIPYPATYLNGKRWQDQYQETTHEPTFDELLAQNLGKGSGDDIQHNETAVPLIHE